MLNIIRNKKGSSKCLKKIKIRYKKFNNVNNKGMKKPLKMFQILNKKYKRNLVKVE